MSQALCQINGVTTRGREVPLTWPATTDVQLNNVNNGGEVSYLWEIVSKPEGSAVVLDNPNIQAPKLLNVDYEGSPLVQLTVNKNLADEKVTTCIPWTRDVKTGERRPAAGETLEVDGANGWATAQNRFNRRVTDLQADSGLLVAVAGQIGLQTRHVLMVDGTTKIKTGLPGEETLPVVHRAFANIAGNMQNDLYILSTGVDGSAAPANGAVLYARKHGLVRSMPGTGSELAGDPVFASNAGSPSWFTPGTIPRQIGHVVAVDVVGLTYDFMFDGHALLRDNGGIIVFGNTTTRNDTTECFLDLGTEDRQAPLVAAVMGEWSPPYPVRINRLSLRAGVGPVDDSQVYTLQKNGLDQVIAATLLAGGTSVDVINDLNAFTMLPSDSLRIECVGGALITTGALRVKAFVGYTRA